MNRLLLSTLAMIGFVSTQCAPADQSTGDTLADAPADWTYWPKKSEDGLESYLRIPPGFESIPPLVSSDDNTLINGRFRSPDGLVEFAIIVKNGRNYPRQLLKRLIDLIVAPDESLSSRRSSIERVQTESDITNFSYQEQITITSKDASYTRYCSQELTTSIHPGAALFLWEFQVSNEAARKKYQEAYKTFKANISLGEF